MSEEKKPSEAIDKKKLLEKKLAQLDVEEVGGPAGPEPTRYGDWERNGRCIDF